MQEIVEIQAQTGILPIWAQVGIFALIAFLLGSFPTGFLLVRFKSGKDIRTVGSGNIGATNVSRVLGKKWAVVAFLIDAFKGFLPLFCLNHFAQLPTLGISFIALSALLGHCYCPWLGWDGGKGVAIAEGILLALVPHAALLGLLTYLIVATTTRISALGSLSALFVTLTFIFVKSPEWMLMTSSIGILILWRHRENIKQLLAKRFSA